MQNIHGDLTHLACEGGLFDVEPCELDMDVGRRGTLVNPNVKLRGTISLTPFFVVGVQKDYRGTVCYRIVHDGDVHGFGSVLLPSECGIQWLT